MAQSVIHSSFAAGEISPNLFARVDLDKYHVGAALMRNFFVDYRGGASTRMGGLLVDRVRYANKRARLFPFIFSQDQAYLLEIGDLYIRFYFQGRAVLEPAKTITGINLANPGIVTAVAHGYSTTADVFISGVSGMFEVNDQTYRIVVIDADHFSLWTEDGVSVDTSGFHPYTSGGIVQRVYTLTSPWVVADLRKLKYTQSADVMTLTHPDYAIYDLRRTGPSTFTLTNRTLGPSVGTPVIDTVTTTTAGNLTYGYVICGVTEDGEVGEPSVVGTVNSKALDPTNAAPVVIAIDWTTTAVPNAARYQIFKYGPVFNTQPQPTQFGYIGETTHKTFTDNNIAPDFSRGPPQFRDPFNGGNFPGCSTYFQQRQAFGGLKFSPEEIDFSKTGAYSNFDVSLTVNANDAIKTALASREVNEIKSMIPMSNGLVVLTSGGAFQISGGSPTSAITPDDITALPQASTGASDLPAILVNNSILFVQNKGATVRDLAFNFYVQTFFGFDRSALANHLFFGHQMLEWAYAEEPFKIVWCVREDGRLLSLTYVPEQEVYGWARHDTLGVFESVCSIPEGDENAVYVIAQRPFNGNSDLRARYIERFASRKFIRVEDVQCLDCAVSRQLDEPAFSLDMTANETQAFIQADIALAFDPTWVGRFIWFKNVSGKMVIVNLASPNQIVCDIIEPLGNDIPNSDRALYFRINPGEWQVASEITHVTGAPHLFGLPAWCLADGEVIGPLMVDASGAFDLDVAATKIIVGFKFQAQLQTLQLDTGEPTIQGMRKKLPAVTMRIDQSRGLKVGDTFATLYEVKEVPSGDYTPPIGLFTLDERVVINGTWSTHGQLCVQQDNPLPATVLGLIPEVLLGDTQR